MPDVATLRLSREQNQAHLNYAEAEQGRPKVNLHLDDRRSPRRFAPRDGTGNRLHMGSGGFYRF